MTAGLSIQFQLKDRLCTVIGGGVVGLRRVNRLLRAGARVRLVTLPPAPLMANPETQIILRPYRDDDLKGSVLAFAATSDREVNAAVAAEAQRLGIPINISDDPASSDFHLPACLTRGDLSIAVTTSGRSPALAAQIRDHLDPLLGPEWAVLVEIAAALRQKRLTLNENAEYNQEILRDIIEKGAPDLIAKGAADDIDTLLTQRLGPGFSLAELGINLPKGRP